MKKLFINSSLTILIASIMATGCTKADFDENYYDPEASVTGNVPGLYAGLFNNDRVIPRYWNLYTFQIPMMGTYSQTSGYTNGQKIYEQAVNYTQDRWNAYYTGTIAQYREIEKFYNRLETDADKTGLLPFLETSRIFVYDQTAQMVDMWGDIPFTEAGQLNASGAIVLPKYDKGEDIYNFILTDLKRISDYLATLSMDPFYVNQFQKYDYVNGGDIMKWRMYANSLRLRLAMRISNVNETAAQAVAQEILGNAAQYPVLTDVADNIKIEVTGSLVSTGNDIRNGFGVNPFAPGYMVDSVMVPAADPRLPVLFTENVDGEYHGVPNSWTAAQVSDATTAGYFSRYDSSTFTENNFYPGVIINASEVSFLAAEAYERWGGGDAKTAYENGIKQSIEFYYAVNSSSSYGSSDTPPAEAEVNNFLMAPGVAYGGTPAENLEKIATQKWIDFSIMQANHAWAEMRRTGYPELSFPTDASSQLSPNVPLRLLYPSTESILNSVNYETVKPNDVVTKSVFWDVQ